MRRHTCTEAAWLRPLLSMAGGPLRSFVCASACAATLSRVLARAGKLWRAETARALAPDDGASTPETASAASEAATSSDLTFDTRFGTTSDLVRQERGTSTRGTGPSCVAAPVWDASLPSSLSVGVRRMADGWEALETPACRGGVNASPEAKGAGLSAVALMVVVVVARSLAAGTRRSGAGRRWA